MTDHERSFVETRQHTKEHDARLIAELADALEALLGEEGGTLALRDPNTRAETLALAALRAAGRLAEDAA